jgi:CubicO group peptidase (beta-lactamase class C family)
MQFIDTLPRSLDMSHKRIMARKTFLFWFLGVFLLSVSARGQVSPREGREPATELRKLAPTVAAKYKVPGLAVALIENGRLRDIVVYGVRDKVSGARIDENTIFEAASLSKPVFAYGVLRTVADGKLNLGSPLTQYLPLPYLREADPFHPPKINSVDPIYEPQFNQITAFRVLNHTSGMPNWARNEHLMLLFPPGAKWSYSSEGYVYLQRVMEHISGEPLETFAERTVLGPLGMSSSSFLWRTEYEKRIATGYDRSGTPAASLRYTLPVASTTLYTTIGDYARFVTSVLASAPRQRAHESAVSLMLNPTVTVDPALSFSWGLGWGLETFAGDLYFFHWGANPGFQSFVMASRKTGQGIVILTNSENGLEAAREIVRATMGGNHRIFESPLLHPD